MTEFEKELNYVKQVYSKVITADDLSAAKRLRQLFLDKYVIKISPTDTTFTKIQNELAKLDADMTKKISSAYLF
jgi:hypothetical protein